VQGHLTKKAGWSFRDMFCAGRVVEEDLKRTMKACGGAIQTSVNSMTDDVLGSCELFEEEQIGGERYMISMWGAGRLGFYLSLRFMQRISVTSHQANPPNLCFQLKVVK